MSYPIPEDLKARHDTLREHILESLRGGCVVVEKHDPKKELEYIERIAALTQELATAKASAAWTRFDEEHLPEPFVDETLDEDGQVEKCQNVENTLQRLLERGQRVYRAINAPEGL